MKEEGDYEDESKPVHKWGYFKSCTFEEITPFQVAHQVCNFDAECQEGWCQHCADWVWGFQPGKGLFPHWQALFCTNFDALLTVSMQHDALLLRWKFPSWQWGEAPTFKPTWTFSSRLAPSLLLSRYFPEWIRSVAITSIVLNSRVKARSTWLAPIASTSLPTWMARVTWRMRKRRWRWVE